MRYDTGANSRQTTKQHKSSSLPRVLTDAARSAAKEKRGAAPY